MTLVGLTGLASIDALPTVDAAFAGGASTTEQASISMQPFTDIGAGLPGVRLSSVAWGDYDNDGDLDVLLTGANGPAAFSRIYRNEGGTFVDIGAGLPGVPNSSVAWGDYDNDGDLDLLLAGDSPSGTLSRIYRNDSGTFVDVAAGLPGISDGAVAWGDYDNDGDLDFLLTGFGPMGDLSRVYRNDGGTFVDIGGGLPGFDSSHVAWGDYDNDGDLDILLTGNNSSDVDLAGIYRNDNGTFVDIVAGLPNVSAGSVDWGDFDNDGDLDVLVVGFNYDEIFSSIYRNDNGAFVDISAGLPGVSLGSAAWGDYDNDGDLDVLLTGYTVSGALARVYRNDSGPFVDIGAGLPDLELSSVAWGDYDNDGDLDFLLTGQVWNTSQCISRIYRNDATTPNTAPAPPTGLSAQFTGNGATFTWNAATDAQTPSPGLSYNLRIGTSPGGNQISSAMAGSANGYRRVPKLGNTNHRLSWTIRLPLAPEYYWSVQAVDAAFAGSAFAVEQTLTPPFTDVGGGLPDVQYSSTAWGDYDNDGDLDVLLTGYTGSEGLSRIYRNTAGTFTDIGAGLPGVYFGSVAWGDYDNDGDLDVLLTGYTGSEGLSRIYRNDGGTFVNIGAGLPGVGESSSAWADYDNDGDLDVLLTGDSGGGVLISRIYRNDGGTFVDIGAGLPGVYESSIAWGDYDNDGDMDILLTGGSGSGASLSRVYRNNGGTFADIGAGLPGANFSSVAWGDYDNDGDLDVVLTGVNSSGLLSRVYRNDGGAFVDINAGLPSVYFGSVAWGDYDNDGDLDLLLTGATNSEFLSRVYRNDGGTFVNLPVIGLPGVATGSVAWGDYDNDNDLDFLLTGGPASGPGVLSRIYRNNTPIPNSAPDAPNGLTLDVVGNSATFSWDAATDAQTPSPGLTYNLRVGTTPDGNEIFSHVPYLANGNVLMPRPGNTNHRRSWTILLPPATPFYWSVQAVDGAYAGSNWSSGSYVSAVDGAPELPASMALHVGTPNPFRTSTYFALDLPKPDRVRVNVFDVKGRLVKTLRDDVLPAGRHETRWDGTDGPGNQVGAGVYFIRLETGNFQQARQIVLLP